LGDRARFLQRTRRCLLLCILLLALPSGAVETFAVGGETSLLARRLQASLPDLAIDKLVEARRHESGWEFRLRVAVSKLSVDELRVHLVQSGTHDANVRIELVRIEGGILWKTETAQERVPVELGDRVKAVLK
jgi:hypothetical protein